jgi:PEP-CTERM motif
MKYGRLIILGGILAGLATPMLADPITYGEFDASGQGGIKTAVVGGKTVGTGLTIGGTTGTTGGGNLRPTGTVTQDGTGDFNEFSESESFFYHFIASGTPAAGLFTFSTVPAAGAAGVEFLQANTDPSFGPVITMKFYITSVEDIAINSGSNTKGNPGGFDGIGYVTFSNIFVPGEPGVLFQQAADYSVETNKGAGLRPLTVEIDLTAPSPAPEPSSLALLGTGMMGVAGFVFRKRRTL